MSEQKKPLQRWANTGSGWGRNRVGRARHCTVPHDYSTTAGRLPSSVWAEVKDRVSCPEAAEFYGLKPNRSGFVRCPFHGERTPSCKLYPGSGGFHCFGCGEGGSVIDLTSRLFGLSPVEALRKLDADFRLGLPLDRPVSAEECDQEARLAEAVEAQRRWRQEALRDLIEVCRVANDALRRGDELTEAEALAIRERDQAASWLFDLDCGDTERESAVWRMREEVERLCRTVLR